MIQLSDNVMEGRNGNALIYFGTDYQGNKTLGFDEIVQKYGTRISNGDKVSVRGAFVAHGKVYGFADGVGDAGEISVAIEISDIAQINWNGQGWEKIG